MSQPLKPLSSLQRKFLALLGETPAQHQAQMQSIIQKTYHKANATEKVVNVHALNKQVESRLTYSAPASELAANLQAKSFVADEWIPDAYVLFIRRWRCRCGRSGTSMDRAELFLRHHHIRQPKRQDMAENSPPILYLPTKVLVHSHLPRLREVVFRSQVVCEECFDEAQGVNSWMKKSSSVSSSPQEPTASSGSEVTTAPAILSEDELLSFAKQAFTYNTLQQVIDSFPLPSEKKELKLLTLESGSASSNSNLAQSAPVQDTLIPIEEDRPSV